RLGVESTARASFYFYNTPAEVDRVVEVVKELQTFFAQSFNREPRGCGSRFHLLFSGLAILPALFA
ncbi:MAG: hypothetical protein MUF81_15010, partial [Verrucomicrobia bacterium]|nr:hypothetical protein [Verrucomicrobiota bacterium]